MKIGIYFLCFMALSFITGFASSNSNTKEELTFYGVSDASALVFLDANHFVVADDESNLLRVYHAEGNQKPAVFCDLNGYLKVSSHSQEADIEAAAKTDDRIYWITSHGRNKNGKIRPNRYRFFCTKLHMASNPSSPPKLIPIGTPCSSLVQQLAAQPFVARHVLLEATRMETTLSTKERKKMAPKKQGLNIEGLTWHPGHRSLLIGLRNPLHSSRDGVYQNCAIVFELKNPASVIEQQKPAEFGNEMYWDLGSRGIRGMEYSQQRKMFFILAGPIDSETTFALYRWDGDFTHQPELVFVWPLNDPFNPEGIAVRPLDDMLWIASDDGTREIPVDSPDECVAGKMLTNGRCPNKYLKDNSRKTFSIQIMDLNHLTVP
jgi:hypothetical protein